MKRVMAILCLGVGLVTLSARAQETPPAPPSTEEPQPQPQQEAEAAQPPAPTLEETASKLDALTEAFTEMHNSVDALSKMRITGYILAQYVNDESSVNALSSAAATRNKDQFSVREARVKFTYQLTPTSRFVLQPEVATSGVSLKDGYVEFTEPWTQWHHTVTAGQFNWPFGFEIAYSSSDRELPERARVTRTLFPSERDRGVQLSGLGFGDRFNYKAALVNGTGTLQTFDFNKRKDFVGRVGGSFGPLDVGVSWYRGAELVSVASNTAGQEFAKQREGIDFQLVTPIRGLGLRGEYIRGKQPPLPNAAANAALAADVTGYYLYAIQNVGTYHQFAVRYDAYDPDSGHDLPHVAANAKVATLGGSYIFHWDENSKIMVAYERLKTRGFADPDDNVFTLRYAYKF
ncbi:MAG: hypothetical protein JO197_16285 [Acidobacteria bacterium]|nr:hypothetical protein [Acidobacteriota bacterium]MBV9475361.1 hypothetical protein [Acidobacteriota bacterium]